MKRSHRRLPARSLSGQWIGVRLAELGFAAVLAALPLAVRAADLVVDVGTGLPVYAVAGGSGTYENIIVGQSSVGTLNQSGGTLATTLDWVTLGNNIGSVGTYNLSGGTLSTFFTDVGARGAGTFTLSGSGVHTMTGGGGVNLAVSSGSTGTYNLNGGTLTTGFVQGGSGNSTFHFNGGTLTAAVNSSGFFDGLTRADVQAGGAKINTAGNAVTIAQGFVSGTASGTPDGGLTKLGAGTLTLTGASTYTGTTTVSTGTLALGTGGSIAGGNVSVGAGATLAISGTGRVAPGAGATLTVDGTAGNPAVLTLGGAGSVSTGAAYVGYDGSGMVNQSGGTFNTNGNDLYLGYTAAPNVAQPRGNGTYLLSGGTLSTRTVYVGYAGTGTFTQTGGSFNTGSLVLGFASSNLSTLSATGTYDLNGGTLTTVSVAGAAPGGLINGSSVFNFNGGTLQAAVGSTAFFQNVDSIRVLTGGARIDTQSFNVIAGQGLVHDPATSNADGGLTKLGTGTLTLSGANTYMGATTVSAGTLAVGTGASVTASASLTVDGATANPAGVTLSGTGNISTGTAYVGYSLGGVGTFAQTGGSLTTNGQDLYVGNLGGGASSQSTYVLSGTGSTVSARTLFVGNFGNGTFTQNDGSVTLGNSFEVASAGPSKSAYNLNGGTLNVAGISYLGNAGTGTFTQTGGTFTTGNLDLGEATPGSGTFTLSGGNVSTAVISVGNSGKGEIDQTGGSINTNGSVLVMGVSAGSSGAYNLNGTGSSLSTGTFYVGYSGTGTFAQNAGTVTTNGNSLILGANSGSSGTYLFGGGTLTTGAVTGTTAGTSAFVFGGGTLRAAADNSAFFQGVGSVGVQSSKATIDTQNFNVTVAQTLLHGSGQTTDGGLTKLGTGILTLSGANTYNGTTTVSAGTLLAGNTKGSATGTGAVVVQSGGTLGGNGTIAGGVTVQSGGTLAPGELGFSRLTLSGTLALQSGSTLALTLGGTTAGSSYDQVQVGSLLTIAGLLDVRTVNGFTLAVGKTFTILDNTSAALTTGAFSNALGPIYTDAAGDTFRINYAANVDGGTVANDVTLTVLTVVPEPSTWALLVLGATGLLGLVVRARRA